MNYLQVVQDFVRTPSGSIFGRRKQSIDQKGIFEADRQNLRERYDYPMKRKLPRGTIARYRDRIVEVLGAVRGQRAMIRSIHSDGAERVTAVKHRTLLRAPADGFS